MKLVLWPDESLSKPTSPVTVFDKSLKEEVSEMAKIMNKERGVGLAANQVGLDKSIFLIDIPNIEEEDGKLLKTYIKRTFINPVVELSGKDISISEGCLSFPGKMVRASRKSVAKVTYQNLFGRSVTEEFVNLAAIVIQHEYDHLQGICFTKYEKEKLDETKG